MTYGEAMAARVLELEAELRSARSKISKLRASRDLWRHRAVRKAVRR